MEVTLTINGQKTIVNAPEDQRLCASWAISLYAAVVIPLTVVSVQSGWMVKLPYLVHILPSGLQGTRLRR